MNVVSLCSGVGLIDLGLEWAGLHTIQLCELDRYATRILEQRYPGVPIHDDVWTIQPAACDVITAGFPCQPFSVAGKQLGDKDPRHLWPAIIRAIRLVRPRYVLLENVPGLVAWGLGEVLGDLAAAGFDAEWTCFNASDVGAPHKRRRWWCVATSDADSVRVWDESGGFFREGWGSQALTWAHGTSRPVADTNDIGRLVAHRRTTPGTPRHQDWAQPVGDRERSRTGDVADTTSKRTGKSSDETITVTDGGDTWVEPSGGSQLSGDVPHADSSAIQPRRIGWGAGETSRPGWWATEPDVGRVAHGVPSRMDRIRCLGNGVVPQCAELIGLRLMQLDEVH